jgi:hypothetical protein
LLPAVLEPKAINILLLSSFTHPPLSVGAKLKTGGRGWGFKGWVEGSVYLHHIYILTQSLHFPLSSA